MRLPVSLSASPWCAALAALDALGARLLDLTAASAPALLLGFLLAGLVHVYLPAGSVRWLKRGGRLRQAAKGVVIGLPLPVCSCGVVPLYRSLVERGAPPAAAAAFLVATPELGLDAVLLSLPLLGPEVAAARVLLAFAVALLAGLAMGALLGARAAPSRPAPLPMAPAAAEAGGAPPCRLARALRSGFVETADAVAPWLVIGLLVAAALDPVLGRMRFDRWPDAVEVALFAALGLPGYVCATAATPLAAAFLAAGASPGAALAFLITGPATNVTTFGVLAKLHGRLAALVFGAVVVGATVACGLAVNGGLAFVAPERAPLVAHAHGVGALEAAALAALLLVLGASLWRRGARGWWVELRGAGAGADRGAADAARAVR